MRVKCPYCSYEGEPRSRQKVSMGGWVFFVVLLFVCLPLCWLPFVMDACKDDEKECAQCGIKFG